MENPTYENFQKFQSKLGDDWIKTSTNSSTEEKSQLFRQYKDKVQNVIKSKLDPESLAQYEAANEYASKNYYPYVANPTLKNVVNKGSNSSVTGNSLVNSIKKTMDKKVGGKYAIPEEHPLTQHLKEMQNKKNIGNLSKSILPTLGGYAIGHAMGHPEFGASAGAGLTAGMLTSAGNSVLEHTIQNPSLQKLLKTLKPLYYGTGRSAINLGNEQDR
jgi:hypothetical protein